MEEDRKHRIQSLAQSISNDFFYKSYVDPYSAADDYEIEVRENDYSDNSGLNLYKGVIWYRNNQFAIHLNTKVLGHHEFDFARFTCAHELGHFFIEEHNALLKSGKSISFNGSDFHFKKAVDPFEQEANLFAANFLLPEMQFREAAASVTPGLSGILDLKKRFHTSITCTAFRYVNLGLSPSMLVLWNDRVTNKELSPQFKSLVAGNPSAILNPKRIQLDRKDHKHNDTKVEYHSVYTSMGSWLSLNTTASDLRNNVVLEETMNTTFFNLSLITLL